MHARGAEDSFLPILEPFEKKAGRFVQRMSERRTNIPEDRPVLKLEVRRGEHAVGDSFTSLACVGAGSGAGALPPPRQAHVPLQLS